MNKTIFSMMTVALIFSSGAIASSVTINDLPNVILTCVEAQDGAVVADGAKRLKISKDQFGQMYLYLTVVQKDQFVGNKTLLNGVRLTEVKCSGYVPCRSFVSQDSKSQFFVNLIPNTKTYDGHLESKLTGSADFACSKK